MKTFDLTVTDIETGTLTRITVGTDAQGVGLRIGRTTWVLSKPDAEVLANALCSGIRDDAQALITKFEEIAELLKRKTGMSLDQFIRKLHDERVPPTPGAPPAPEPPTEGETDVKPN